RPTASAASTWGGSPNRSTRSGYEFKNRPTAEDIFTSQYLPPAAERKLGAAAQISPVVMPREGGASSNLDRATEARSRLRDGPPARAMTPERLHGQLRRHR